MAVLIDSAMVCDKLGIKPNHLYQLQYRKKIKWIERKGNKVFYDLADVEALKAMRDEKNLGN